MLRKLFVGIGGLFAVITLLTLGASGNPLLESPTALVFGDAFQGSLGGIQAVIAPFVAYDPKTGMCIWLGVDYEAIATSTHHDIIPRTSGKCGRRQ